jgi:predicted MFS family arabinose efflux permease
MTQTLTPKRELWLLITLAGIQFTSILDFMIMMPLGPQFTQLFQISDAKFGLLVSAYTLAAGFSGLLASTYIDKVSRKRLLLTLYPLFALATLACGLSTTYEFLMAARIAAGIFGGVLSSLSQTIVGDVIPFERRGRAMGFIMTSFSVASVLGVPLGLFVAAHLSWHATFIGIAILAGLFAIFAAVTLPKLNHHLLNKDRPSTFDAIRQVLADPNHLKAFLFSILIMFAGFTAIPYITIYMQSNVGIPVDQIPYIYLCGGAVTFFTARWFGRLTDSFGKAETFRVMAVLVVIPLMAITLLPPLTIWYVLPVSTMLFVFMSGRMIPGMAILTSAADPRLRGTFMTLNSAVQSAAMGVAAYVGGSLISRDAMGHVQGYWMAAAVGSTASLLALFLVGKIRMDGVSRAMVKEVGEV